MIGFFGTIGCLITMIVFMFIGNWQYAIIFLALTGLFDMIFWIFNIHNEIKNLNKVFNIRALNTEMLKKILTSNNDMSKMEDKG